jgi:adenosine/AMP kinase
MAIDFSAVPANVPSGARLIAGGAHFVVALRNGFPINVVSSAVKTCPEVANVSRATANPLEILVAETPPCRDVAGVVNGEPPLRAETEGDAAKRLALHRKIGYQLG